MSTDDKSFKESMKRSDDSLARIKSIYQGDNVDYIRRSPTYKLTMRICVDRLTDEQKQQLDRAEKILLSLAEDAEEEIKTTTQLKGTRP